jgi:lipopolysaccharide transport system permease protein
MANKDITTYIPDKAIRQGYLNLFREMLHDVISTRWLTFLLLKRNFIANYKQSMLGIFWAFLAPLGSVVIFVLLNAGGVFNVGDTGVPYPLYALTSTALWQVFSGGVTLGLGSLVAAGGMIKKVHFPREVLIFSAVGQTIVPIFIQVLLILAVFAYVKIVPPVTILLVPFAMIPMLLITLGGVFILSVLNAFARDVGGIVGMGMTLLMFLTPILYARPQEGILATISQYNPFYYLIVVPRDLFLFGSTEHLTGYMYSSIIAFVVFLACWIAFRLAGTRMVERL